jgi:hypothetical protein
VITLLAQSALAAIPEWVRQAASQPTPAYSPETKAVVLLDDTEYTVTGAGEFQEHYRRVVRILRPDGREQADLHVHLQQHEKLVSIHAWTLDTSGREYELKEKDFAEAGAFADFILYSDDRMRTAVAPAAQPGSVIAFEYEVHRHAWLNQLNWSLHEDIPVREVRLTLSLPPRWEYKTLWAATPPIQPSQTGANRWEWVTRDLAAIEDEPMRPPLPALAGRMKLTYFVSGDQSGSNGSWESLA